MTDFVESQGDFINPDTFNLLDNVDQSVSIKQQPQ